MAKPFLAYFDSAAGVVPVKVLEAWPGRPGGFQFRIQVTGRTNHIYPCGKVLEASALSVFPRYALIRRRYGSRIAAYDWKRHVAELPMREARP